MKLNGADLRGTELCDFAEPELEELLCRLWGGDEPELEAEICAEAAALRDSVYGKRVFMRGLLEISSYCRRECLYCGLRRRNRNAQRYRLSPDTIFDCCKRGYGLGFRTFVLQSGEDPWFTDERTAGIVARIKEAFPDAAVTLSLGERSPESYRLLREAGADRYLLRHETADADLYGRLHPDSRFELREKALCAIKEAGFQTGAGFMCGLPGETARTMARNLLFLKELQPEMVGIGPFIPHSETPLRDAPVIGSDELLRKTVLMVALTRLMLPGALLPSTTALGTVFPQGRERALAAGANVVMPNLSPLAVRKKYALYEDKICSGDDAAHCLSCITGRIGSVGLEVDMGRGDPVSVGEGVRCEV